MKELTERVVGLLKTVFHVATPLAMQQRLCDELRAAAVPVLDRLRVENGAAVNDAKKQFVRESAELITKLWTERVGGNPQPKEPLKQVGKSDTTTVALMTN